MEPARCASPATVQLKFPRKKPAAIMAAHKSHACPPELSEYTPLRESDRERLLPFLDSLASDCCEYCFANLFLYRDVYGTRFVICGDVLFLTAKFGGVEYDCPPILLHYDEGLFCECVDALCERHFDAASGPVGFGNVTPQEREVLERRFPGRFAFDFDRKYSEYIYSADDLRAFPGKALHAKRNHLNKFLRQYDGRWSYEPLGPANIADCHEMSRRWSEENSYYLDNSLVGEIHIVDQMLNEMPELGLIGGCVRVDGRIAAFTIGEAAHTGSDTLVVHVEKALYEYEGIYPAICSAFVSAPEQARFAWVNREDDVGDEGLRQSKLSYRPARMIDKYMARLVK